MKLAPTSRAPLAAAAGLLLAAGLGSRAWAGAQDKIYQKGAAEPVLAVITGESIDEIKSAGGAEGAVSFPTRGVDRIDYADRPFAFKDGEEKRKMGRYAEAIDLLGNAMRTDPRMCRQFWLLPGCRFQIAMCYLEDGSDMKTAKAKFEEFLENHRDSRYLLDAYLGLGRVLFAAKDYDGALTRFGSLAAEAVKKNWEEFMFLGYLWQGRTLMEQGKYDQALDTVERVIKGAPPDKYGDIVIQAKTAKATILVRQEKFDKAVALFRELIKEIGPFVAREIAKESEGSRDTRMQRTEAQCYNELGQCYLLQGAKSGKKDDLREALLAFLWNVVLHSRLRAEYTEALFNAAVCFEKLGERPRAAELRNELLKSFPESPQARKLGAASPAKSPEPRKESGK